jgi:hypothetical protein
VPYRAIGSVFFDFDHADCFERRTAWTTPSFPSALFHDEYKTGLLPSEETLIIYSSAFKQTVLSFSPSALISPAYLSTDFSLHHNPLII